MFEPPAGVRKRRKATVKKQRNTAPGLKALDPIFVTMILFLFRYSYIPVDLMTLKCYHGKSLKYTDYVP